MLITKEIVKKIEEANGLVASVTTPDYRNKASAGNWRSSGMMMKIPVSKLGLCHF